MTLTLNLKPELETKVKHEAAKRGLDVNDNVLNAVQECLQRDQKNDTPGLGKKESQLLQKINHGLSPETWQRYRELIEKRRQETLTPGVAHFPLGINRGIAGSGFKIDFSPLQRNTISIWVPKASAIL